MEAVYLRAGFYTMGARRRLEAAYGNRLHALNFDQCMTPL
jgi:hypothetical protein